MSQPSHRAAAAINKRARKHYPKPGPKAPDAPVPASPPAPADSADPEMDLPIANIEGGGWAGHKSDLDWPIEDDPFLFAIGLCALAVLAIGAVTILGGLGFCLWQVGTAIIHSLHP